MDPLLTAISTHLGFLGYTTPPVPELPPNVEVVNAVHPLKPPFWVLPLHGGAFFRGIYVTTTNAQQDPAGFLNFINEVNAIMALGHFYTIDQQNLVFGAWYYGPYDSGRLGIFIDRYLVEVSVPHKRFKQQSERYLAPSRYS